jgi:putative tricarboxylic transport membrane protein
MAPEILQALLNVLNDPTALGLSVIGVLLGIILGALPGVSSTMSLAVLLPVSFSMSPMHGMMFLMGIFSASVYGGSISAILVNIPGTPGAIVTQMDGYPMAQKGRAGEALTYALLASTFGGILGWLLLVVLAPLVAQMALHFQSPEYAAVTFFGLTMLAYATPGSTFKALIGGVIGLILSTVGLDEVTGASRFDFGIADMQGGIGIIPVAVGIFGLAEVLRNIEGSTSNFEVIKTIKRLIPPWREIRPLWPMAVRGSVIGALVGAIPAAGSAIGVTVAYAQEKRMSDDPDRYGTGIPEGIVSPESANNACVGGALVPMMTLGIPGDSMTAVMVGALLIHGLRPGPQLFVERLDFVAIVYVALLLAILLTLLFGLVGIRAFARILNAPKNVLMTAVAMLCVVGSYAVRNSVFDVLVMIASGAIGYLMHRVKMPVAPVVFGLILGPLLEENIRRSLIVNGDWWVFVTRPISLVLLLISIFALIYPAWRDRRRKAARASDQAG